MSEAYLKLLYTPQAQEIIASNYYRPRNPQVAAKYASSFPKIQLFTIDRNFGGWARALAGHFTDGGLFDQIFAASKRYADSTCGSSFTTYFHTWGRALHYRPSCQPTGLIIR